MIEISCPRCNARLRIDGKTGRCEAAGGRKPLAHSETLVPDNVPTPSTSSTEASSSKEKIFLADGSIRVTSAWFRVGSRRYAIEDIASVKQTYRPPRRAVPIFMAALGLLLVYLGTQVLGVSLIILAVFWLGGQYDSYSVSLVTPHGKMRVFTSIDQEYISRIVAALNEAVVRRG